jgi:hypothetical protein
MSLPPDGLPEELQGEQVVDLPSREALSIVDPGIFGVGLPQIAPRPVEPVGPPTAESAEPTTPQ